MTKAVTGAAAMQLVEKNCIGLEQPMGEVLPVAKDVKVLEGFNADGTPRLRDPRVPISLQHLLTHTSGYGYDIFNPNLARYIELVELPSILTRKNDALRVPLLFDPGTDWEYGIGIDLVGKVIEAVTGQDLESYFRRHIFDPLGMHDTSFLLRNDMAQRLVGTHIRGSDGNPVAINVEPADDGEFHTGGAGLFSSAPDYLTFTRMLLAGGTFDGVEVLKPETVKLMTRNAIGDLNVPMIRSSNPALALEVETFPGQVKKWGLTFLINTEAAPAGRSAGSLAWGGLNNTYYWLDPSAKVAGIFMTQILPFADEPVLQALDAFESAVYRVVGKKTGK